MTAKKKTSKKVKAKTFWENQLFLGLSLVLLIIITIVNVYFGFKKTAGLFSQPVLGESTTDLTALKTDLAFWQNQLTLYPEARDIYLKLAVLSYEMSDFTSAAAYLAKSREIDPNFALSQQLQEKLDLIKSVDIK